MKIIADTHCHTIASTHAYSTVLENAQYASHIGLAALAITDHGPKNLDAPHVWHFENLHTLPRTICGVTILGGVEANIMDYEGTLDLNDSLLARLDWVIASYHRCNCEPGTVEQHTQAYCKLARNPYVDVIGHSGLTDYQYDYVTAIKTFKEYDKLVEINQNTFDVRKTSIQNCTEIARLCKKYEVPVVVNSDSHFAYNIGMVDDAIALLEGVSFPEKLILNTDPERFNEYLTRKRHISIF